MRILAIAALCALTAACNAPTSTPTVASATPTEQAATRDTATGWNDSYLDDRSSAQAILNSYYNAINRKEYARAWTYWGENSEVEPYETFKKGFGNTKNVDLRTGETINEGAAGSTYSTVRTGLSVTNEDGTKEFFEGCYTTHLSQPVIQDTVPFKPLSIREAKMTKVADEAAVIAAMSKPCETH